MNKLINAEIIKNNSYEYNVLKLLEEMSELSEVLLKTLTKRPDYRPPLEKLVEETGDVELRLAVFKEMIGSDLVDQRVEKKQQSLSRYFSSGKKNG